MNKEKEIEKLQALLIEKSNSANVELVFTDNDGIEYRIDNEKALEVINNILEQAFIPFLAEQVINAGYGNVKQAVKGFAEELKRRLKLGIYGAYIWKYAEVDCEIIDNLVKKFNGEDKESE